jgi:hypothetical protein
MADFAAFNGTVFALFFPVLKFMYEFDTIEVFGKLIRKRVQWHIKGW